MLKLSASAIGLQVMDRLRHKVLKRGILIDEAESDVLALFSFPKDDRPKIDITNPLKRLNGEIKRTPLKIGCF